MSQDTEMTWRWVNDQLDPVCRCMVVEARSATANGETICVDPDTDAVLQFDILVYN